MHFKESSNLTFYLMIISNDLIKSFSKEEINFLKSCCDKKVDLIALEFLLRKKNKNNILSFIFFRLSSLAETNPENQNMYINKSKLSFFKILKIMLNSIINLIIFKLKKIFLAKEIRAYNKCKK